MSSSLSKKIITYDAVERYHDNLEEQLNNEYLRKDELVQSDWACDGNTSNEYIKNRTHYSAVSSNLAELNIQDGWNTGDVLCSVDAYYFEDEYYGNRYFVQITNNTGNIKDNAVVSIPEDGAIIDLQLNGPSMSATWRRIVNDPTDPLSDIYELVLENRYNVYIDNALSIDLMEARKQLPEPYIPASIARVEDVHDLLIPIAYDDLKNLRNNSQLIPGQKYRIIDYETTTSQAGTTSANHPFDVIVTALDERTLSENASAVRRENDTYFETENLEAWQLKYCLDNDTERFAWANNNETATESLLELIRPASGVSGSGTYTYSVPISKIEFYNNTYVPVIGVRTMINSGPPVYITKIDACTLVVEDPSTYLVANGLYVYGISQTGKGVIYNMIDEYGNECPYDFKNIKFELNALATYIYTFTWIDENYNVMDTSVFGNNGTLTYNGEIYGVYGNVIKPYYADFEAKQILNNITFISDYEYEGYGNEGFCGCFNNCFDNGCYNISFGNGSYNSFGNSCNSNSFGNSCNSNSFGNGCSSNSFGNSCNSNSFGNSCYNISFGNGCNNNSFGNGCNSNSFGNSCSSNSFGNSCNSNSFGNSCNSNSFGNNCYCNSFRHGPLTTGTVLNYCHNNHFDDACCYNVIWNSVQPTSSNILQNINVVRGVAGTSSAYNFINIVDKNAAYEIKVAKNSSGAIKIYCEADLIK